MRQIYRLLLLTKLLGLIFKLFMIISFFQNNMTDLVKDCTAALELNPKYTKALSRRAKAFQNLGQLSECLEDITALCILEGFSNPRSLETADTVLKDLGRPSTLYFYDFSSQNEVFVEQAILWRTLTTSLQYCKPLFVG